MTALQAFFSSVEVNAPRRRPLPPAPRAPLPAPAPAQYVHILPILRERAAHMPYKYLESFKTIFLEILNFTGIVVVFTTSLIVLGSGMVTGNVVWYWFFDCFDCFGRSRLADRTMKINEEAF